MPGMEMEFLKDCACCLFMLLRKKELLTHKDIQLPWKPLYEVVKSIRKIKKQGFEVPYVLEFVLAKLAQLIRNYFPIESTEEMLLEFRPLMCPLEFESKIDAAYYFSNFLPTRIPSESRKQGYELWLEELLMYWFSCIENDAFIQFEINTYEDLGGCRELYLKLFATLASDNVGYINWAPYATKVFNRILSNLSICLKKNGGCSIILSYVPHPSLFAKWIVYMLGGDQSATILDHLEKLFVALKSHYHPSNHGYHSDRLLDLLEGLSKHFAKRLSCERYRAPSPKRNILDHAKLNDTDIERFVLIVRDSAFLSIFGKTGSGQVASVFHNLALIRCDLILPRLLERTYEALETLVEPHQVTATLSCITSVARVLVSGSDHMPSAPTNILPLLRLVLPGIDPNDLDKTICAFKFISAITSFIPLVDCTPALNSDVEMTAVEKVLCEESGQFEDVVLQFLDRCLVLIENNAAEKIYGHESHHSVRIDEHHEKLSRYLVATVRKVFQQCSKDIFQSVLECLFVFISTRVLETDFAGKLVSAMCREAAVARPVMTLQKFLPYIINCVKNLAEVDGSDHGEHTDAELLWYLEMLSGLVKCNGECLLPYKDVFKEVLRLTLHLKCKKTQLSSIKILQSILSALTKIYVLEWQSSSGSLDQSPVDHFYVRDWGKPGDIDNLNVQWHTSNSQELEFVNELLLEFMMSELDELNQIVRKEKAYLREEVHSHLQILAVCLKGCETVLPMWVDKKVENLETHTFVSSERSTRIILTDEMKTWTFCITRKHVADSIHELFEFLRMEKEDDAKSFSIISEIYQILMLEQGFLDADWNMKNDVLKLKEHLKDKFHGKRRNARCFYIERVEKQHLMRVHDNHTKCLTYTDKILLDDLLLMATSEYTQVRIDSQHTLEDSMERFTSLPRYVLPTLLKDIRPDSVISHEKLKGILHILSHRTMTFLITRYWDTIEMSWALIAQANLSEKPSIISLSEELIKEIQSEYKPLNIKAKIDKSCIAIAKELLQTAMSYSDEGNSFPSEGLLEKSQAHFAMKYKDNEKYYYSLEKKLCMCISDRSTHWRSLVKCIKLLYLLRYNKQVTFSPFAVETCVNKLIHDSLDLRKEAVKLLVVILDQQKPNFKRIEIDYSIFGINPTKNVLLSLQPGDNRPDNEWLQYQESKPIKSQKDLDVFVFVDKSHWGYQTWPKQLKTYSIDKEFYSNNQSRETLPPCNKTILDAFLNTEFFEEFVKYFSIEKKKFSVDCFQLFQRLFRNYGSILFNPFKNVIEDLLSEKCKGKECLAAEIIGGMIRGSKHWNFKDLETMWDFLIPLLRDLLDSIAVEKPENWERSLKHATKSLDPNRFHRLFEMLADNPLSTKGGSQADVQRLSILVEIIRGHKWRLGKKYHGFLKYLLPYLTHPFQNVRAEIGRLLAYMFDFDIQCGNYTPSRSPHVKLLIDYTIKDLTALNEATLLDGEQAACLDNRKTKEEKDRILKTVLEYLYYANILTTYSACKEIYRIIPMIMPMISREDDPDIVELCKKVFCDLAPMTLPEDSVEFSVHSVIQVCHHKSWKARECALIFLQEMIFFNLFAMDTKTIKDDLKNTLIERLKDVQIEVREKASELFSGLVHYGYFSVTSELLKTFYGMAETKYTRKDNNGKKSLQTKHGGVLGLSAVVLAFPYDVEAWMPEVVIHLGNYLHGVPQVVATAKDTLLEFRRTHQDNWHQHRQTFTDDQLNTLTDLLISPSYYA